MHAERDIATANLSVRQSVRT